MATNINSIANDFEARTIDVAHFKHIDHIAAACGLLLKYDFEEAAYHYARTLRILTIEAGATRKFNVTVTIAFLGLIKERMITTPHETFEEFMTANTDLITKNPLLQWYSTNRLNSDMARNTFLLPDKLAS
ncbi:MAG: hypothetical protein COB92_03645 [Robiginitomaculum sp.]|nr:MAG: hypothetical protein COB92_03645 [Robiginitomaculum sp.]